MPFEIIWPEANKIAAKAAEALLRKDVKAAKELWNTYKEYLKATGWSEVEFEREELKQIETGW